MLKDISKYNFNGRSQFVRLRGKYTHQCTHCALQCSRFIIFYLLEFKSHQQVCVPQSDQEEERQEEVPQQRQEKIQEQEQGFKEQEE